MTRLVIGLMCGLLILQACRTEASAVVPEMRLWALAKNPILPSYPTTSISRGTSGVVVAQVQIERDGRVSHVEVLEAPDGDTAKVVAASVSAWQFSPFRPATTAQALRVRGKITLYFELNGREGTVLSSVERIQRRSRRR